MDFNYCISSLRKCYITVVTQALVACLICTPLALGPAALGLRVYISGRPLVPVLQLLNNDVSTCMHAHCVKALASNISSLATEAKQSLEMFNSAQCTHEQVNILMHF